MDKGSTMRIQAKAAEALAEWKAYFSQQVAVQAIVIANNSDSPGLVTLDHYRQAALIAAESLAIAVREKGTNHGSQKAA